MGEFRLLRRELSAKRSDLSNKLALTTPQELSDSFFSHWARFPVDRNPTLGV
jgi:hypothetical protein